METTYYSVYIPTQGTETTNALNVFTEKEEALKVLKGNKDGRLKAFKNKEDASSYSQTGHEAVIQKFPDLKSPSATAEKATFHAPSKQERINFRKAIEEGNYNKVKELIWSNPRFLVNIGDTPTSLKDGYRYNALHICAIHKKAEIAELILQTINTIGFVELLHGKKNTKICHEVCEILLDYYLNMPEKGRSETPLHLAVKYGAVEVVEVLTTYPQCKMIPNLENLMPKDVICDRMNDVPVGLKEKIANLLEERFYVPVIRSVDGTVPPVVGQPFSPTNPPELNVDPLSPELEIQAYAGPMTREQAQSFRRRWKTPPRSTNNSPSRSMINICNSPLKPKIVASTPRKLFGSPSDKILNKASSENHAVRSLFSDASDINYVKDENDYPQNLNADTENGNCIPINNNNVKQNMKKTSSNNEENTESPLNMETNNNGSSNELVTPTSTHSHQRPIVDLDEKLIQDTDKQFIKPKLPLSTTQLPAQKNLINRFQQSNNVNMFSLTPILKNNPAKKDLFFTYRETATTLCDSPIIGFLSNSGMNNSSISKNSNFLINESIVNEESALALREMHVKLSDTEKGLEIIGRELAKEQNIDWKEYWDFLGTFIDIASNEGLNKLEEHLKKQKQKAEEENKKNDSALFENQMKEFKQFSLNEPPTDATAAVKKCEKMVQKENELIDLCNELHKLGLIKDKTNTNSNIMSYQNKSGNLLQFIVGDGWGSSINRVINRTNIINSDSDILNSNGDIINGFNEKMTTSNSGNQLASVTTTPYLCVEKSVQVFAKRCAKTILHNIKNSVSIQSAFLSELKRLKSLICSFKEDQRFLDVNFNYVHSRFANLIVNYIKNSQDIDNETINEIEQHFEEILELRNQTVDKNPSNFIPLNKSVKDQFQCVAEYILKFVGNQEPEIIPENIKTEKICVKTWLNEHQCECKWETKLSRQASRRKRNDSNSSSTTSTLNEVSRKLLESASKIANSVLNNDETNSIQSNTNEPIDLDSWRKPKTDSIGSDESLKSDSTDSDDDLYYSDIGSDDSSDDCFYTPPDTPTMLELNVSDIHDYHVYLLGPEPTKRDLDVLNAIFHVEIDKQQYPNIYLWRAALLKYPNDERDNFPSPTVIVKKRITPRDSRINNLIGAGNSGINKRLFGPSKLMFSTPLSPVKNHLTKFANDNNIRQNNNVNSNGNINCSSEFDLNSSSVSETISPVSALSSTTTLITPTTTILDSEKNLSFMNVSDC